MVRPSWDETWMGIADVMSLRSRCDGAKIGAVIVDIHNRPVSTGYNGPPAGFVSEDGCGQWCPRRMSGDRGTSYGLTCPAVHAEANALMFADRRTYEGGTIYVTASCCEDCTKLVANSGLKRVVMRVRDVDQHRKPYAMQRFLQECGLQVDVL